MMRAFLSCLSMYFVLSTIAAVAQNRCSTEKVNHTDCTFTLDRRYPVTFPTFQMDHGKKITVIVRNPLAFETLSLDETGATLLPGTDQGAALLTSAIPDLAGLSFLSSTAGGAATANEVVSPNSVTEGSQPETAVSNGPDLLINSELQDLRKTLTAAKKAVADSLGAGKADSDGTKTDDAASESKKALAVKVALLDEVTAIYWQLNQILSPVPRPLTSPDAAPPANAGRPKSPKDAPQPVSCPITPPSHSLPKAAAGTPSPWDCYPDWRTWMVCELASECSAFDPAGTTPGPKFQNVLGEVALLQGRLASGATPPPNPIFDQKGFDQAAGYAHSDIEALPCTKDPDDTNVDKTVVEKHVQECKTKKEYEDALNEILLKENHLVTQLSVLSGVLTSVQKDFLTYYSNINLTGGTLLATKTGGAVPEPDGSVGLIFDPSDGTKQSVYPRFLGRNVTWSVNVVNQIATLRTSVTTTASKTSIATITVIYANPHFEASAGAIFSFVHNRTFTNVTQSSGAIDVQETGARPEVIPFVAGNYRLREFEVPVDHRRGAVYATAYVGLNPYTTLPEFGGGPTVSWRSFMLSAFYERAHDTHLIMGETLGPICGATATSTPPACTTTPPAPTASPYWTNGFGIGISIRVPTTFAPGTGGISQ